MSQSGSDSKDSVIILLTEDLTQKKERFAVASFNHKKHEKFYGKINLSFSISISVLLAAATFLGALSAKGAAEFDALNITVLVFNAVATILSVCYNILKFPNKISRHHGAAGQYSDLAKDLQVFLVKKRSKVELDEQETVILEKEKMIDASKLNLGAMGCLTVVDTID